MVVGDQIAPDGAPEEVFSPGRRIRIWRSPTAPDFGVEEASVNELSVVARPTLPGLGSFLGYVAATLIFVGRVAGDGLGGRAVDAQCGQIDIRGAGRSHRCPQPTRYRCR